MITKEITNGGKSDFNTPVVLLFFTRQRTLEQVFRQVKKIKPRQLFLIQDGARKGRSDDIKNIKACRSIVDTQQIDWECEVYRNYSEVNQGTCYCQFNGFSWVFDNVDRAIILEDDCLPNLSFFRFCDELLERYKDDQRINMITGYNFFDKYPIRESYFFGKSGTIWGWATWSRVWKLAEVDCKSINNDSRSKKLFRDINKRRVSRRYSSVLGSIDNKLAKGEWSTWDAQFGFVKDLYYQVAIIPKQNLVNNIGIGDDTAHFSSYNTLSFDEQKLFKRNCFEMEFPLIHPQFIIPDKWYDDYCSNIVYPFLIRRGARVIDRKIKRLFHFVVNKFNKK